MGQYNPVSAAKMTEETIETIKILNWLTQTNPPLHDTIAELFESNCAGTDWTIVITSDRNQGWANFRDVIRVDDLFDGLTGFKLLEKLAEEYPGIAKKLAEPNEY